MSLKSFLSSAKCRGADCYEVLHFFNIVIAVVDCIFTLIRVGSFTSEYTNEDGTKYFINTNKVAVVGFSFDMVGSIVPLTTFIFIFGTWCYLIGSRPLPDGLEATFKQHKEMRRELKKVLQNSSVQRFVTLNCNCPCYITRPKHRFVVRMIFLLFCFVCRFIGFILYLSSKTGAAGRKIATYCGITWIFLILGIILQIFHYRIWWHYLPSCDLEQKLRQPLSKKHKRYIPYHLLGNHRTMKLGNRPCSDAALCNNRTMEHILIFHFNDHTPQPRWSEVRKREIHTRNHGSYIGFQRTSANHAVNIAHNGFSISNAPQLMLGFGIYFARSRTSSQEITNLSGASICAEIRMGKVLQVNENDLNTVRDTNAWWEEYDTVYYNHEDQVHDEFCIKSPDQVLSWIIVVDEEYDTLVRQYKLPEEFDDIVCGCV